LSRFTVVLVKAEDLAKGQTGHMPSLTRGCLPCYRSIYKRPPIDYLVSLSVKHERHLLIAYSHFTILGVRKDQLFAIQVETWIVVDSKLLRAQEPSSQWPFSWPQCVTQIVEQLPCFAFDLLRITDLLESKRDVRVVEDPDTFQQFGCLNGLFGTMLFRQSFLEVEPKTGFQIDYRSSAIQRTHDMDRKSTK
jgi:hypothetical protein